MLIKLDSFKNNYLFLLIFIILCIRIVSLYFSPLEVQGDEAQYWYWSTYFDWGYYSKPPLVAWIIGIFTSTFGNSIFILKLPSLLAHFLTSFVLFNLSKAFNRNTEESLWLSITYLLFFAVSLSSNIISTDPFLLLFWSSSLLFFKICLNKKSIKNIILTSIFVALGFYAKYAMIYFFLSSIVLISFTDNKKELVKSILIISFFVLIFISPHLYWVYSTNWVTFIHTGDNFNWNASLYNFEQLINFIVSQFFISTPIILFIFIKQFAKTKKFIQSYSFEIAFSLPILVLITAQSFISRANANWSSVAFIGVTMIAVNILYKNYKKIFLLNTALGLVVLILISVFIINPPNISPFNKLMGMEDAAKEIQFLDESLNSDYIVFDDRMNIAKFLYYLPSKNKKLKYLSYGDHPGNHFEMLMPITIDEITNKKIIMIHRYDLPLNFLKEHLLVKQTYEMPNSKNNFHISYFE
ncbi:glycosyltransferase family 39 protein [Alphaproteobacteria bacterium]|jgi:4-amino-4-deoxy-L-arabinose transferase-like glycosyltransferase|nr:glycosyltransferase family 39 protein [Alphaproteobacteria bacterium]